MYATDHETNGQADGPSGAAVLDADPPVEVSVATEHQPGPNQGHDHLSALIVTIGDECIPLDRSHLADPEFVHDLRQTCELVDVPVIFEVADLLGWPDGPRWAVLKLVAALGPSVRLRLGESAEHTNVFDAVLAALVGDADAMRCERGRRAALEAALLTHPDDLPTACFWIARRLRELGIGGVRGNILVRQACELAEGLADEPTSNEPILVRETRIDSSEHEPAVRSAEVDATAAAPFLPLGRADVSAAGPEVRAEPPAADPGARLPASLEGWQARFPELGPLRFGVRQDVLPGRAPTDVLTPRERSEFGLGLVRFFIGGYEPAPVDPDGEVLAILAVVGPYLAGIDAKAWPMLAFDAAMGPRLASEDDDAPRSRPTRRLGRWTPVRGYKVPSGTPKQVLWARDLKADRWGRLVNALHAELDESEAALSRFVDTIKKGFPPEAATLRRDFELALTLETLDEEDAKFWIEERGHRDAFVVRQAWSEMMSRIGRRYSTPAFWQAEIERCQRGLPNSPEDRAEPDPPPEMARRRILKALACYPAGETERVIARRIKLTPTETKQFLDRMVTRGEVEAVTVDRPRGKNQALGGYKLVGLASAPAGGGGGGEGEPHDHGRGPGGS
jgi:hypothetical protein